MKFIVHTDGGSRGNPGEAAIGVVIERSKIKDQRSKIENTEKYDYPLPTTNYQLVTEFGKRIGETTNNVAEYTAVLEGLRNIKYQISKIKSDEKFIIQCYLDSLLVVQQLNGIFKIKDARLRDLLFKIKSLEQEIGGEITYTHIPREENARADAFVNKALDGAM
ncbi:ribonuclease HI family protein [Candidatus Gottesmanbacteria bacterium]|nr:ribonuclease HI family protein [Candidatus Gottesmanbacteria bacterium]